MSPIDKVSDIRWFPRLGKIHMGIKKEGQRGPYPSATDFFVCPEEVKAVYKDQPRELDVMFPSDDLELVAPQWYKCYSYSQGLICKGDGKTCQRKVDIKTRDFANRDTKQWEMFDGDCHPDKCPMIASKQCRKMMSLLFILHKVPGLGVYQLDTSSFYSIVNLNSQLAPDGFLRHFTRGRIAFIPLILSLGPRDVNPPGEGRKTVHVLNIRADVKLADIIRISRQKPSQVLLPTLEEEEPPEDLYPEEVLAEAEGVEVIGTSVVTDDTTLAASPKATEQEASSSPPKTQKRKTRAARPARPAIPATSAAPEPQLEPEPADVTIDLQWLNETLKLIKWSEETAKTWLSRFKDLNTEGTLLDVLNRLKREQAEEFTRELQDRAAKAQLQLL